jgi:D-alanyl-D-alanine carboxypeptidase (penicillin-binding protein 5/6)
MWSTLHYGVLSCQEFVLCISVVSVKKGTLPPVKLVSRTVFFLYLLVLTWLVLFKFSLDLSSAAQYQTGLNLVPYPFANAAYSDTKEMVANLIVFIPFGLLLSLTLKQSGFGRKLGLVLVFSLAAEIVQFAFAIGAADITDVVMNTAGGMLGLLLYAVCSTFVHVQKLDRYIVGIGLILLMAIPGILFSGVVRFQSAPGSKAMLSSSAAAKNLKPAWPTTGVAAIGTVEDGVLARSAAREKQRPIASMAKVIAALAILDKQPLMLGQSGESYTITADDVADYQTEVARGGSTVQVHEGMVLSQYQAMQMILLASANNIADMLVERTFGSEEEYVAYAQDMLQRNGFSQTVIADASGYDSSTVSTPSEMVALGIEALTNPVIAEIVAQQQARIPGVGYIQNTNTLLGVDGVVGLKTGTTDEAGSCLLFAGRYTAEDGRKVTIVGVVMGSENATAVFLDSERLLASAKQGLGVPGTQSTNAMPPPMRGQHAPRQ